jgi:signal transduction histidine kinase
MMLKSIRVRMTAFFSLSIAVLMLTVCGGWSYLARHTAERNADALLKSAAQKLQNELSGRNLHPDTAELLEEERDIENSNLALIVTDAAGKVVQKTPGRVPGLQQGRQQEWRIETARSGSNTIVVGFPWAKTDRELRRQALLLLELSLVVVIAAALGAWVLVGKTLSPIDRLAKQAQAVSVLSLNVRLDAPSEDAEVVGLVRTLNGLLERLEETAAAKGRFYAAASHELRTPLQALSGHLELALQRERTNAEYHGAIAEASEQTRRLTSLIQDLLLLNQLDSLPSVSTPVSEKIDLGEVCDRVLTNFCPLIEARSLLLKVEMPPHTLITASPNHTDMLVRNLVENAVKYADPGGEVRIALSGGPEKTQLTIFNNCSPPAPEILSRLCEPFYRPDASRNSETGGNGLGLAICKAIADANGWDLSLAAQKDGFLVSVLFCPMMELTQGGDGCE